MTNMAEEQSGGDGGAAGKTVAVVLAGVITSALALFGVWWLDANTKDWHIMGWYGDYVIPAGALIVGFASGSGYGIASYITGLRIRRGLLWSVLALQLGAYAAAQHLEFSALMREHPMVEEDGAPLSFPRYYHLTAINFAWDDHGQSGAPLGMWGYVFVGLGVLGFVAGGVLAPAVLIKVPYCDRCHLYMKRRSLALVPASAKTRRFAKNDSAGWAAHAAEDERAVAMAHTVLERVAAHAAKGDARAIQSELAPYPPRGAEARRANKLLRRLQLGLVHCRDCGAAYLQPTFLSGQGHGLRTENLARTDVMPDLVRRLAS